MPTAESWLYPKRQSELINRPYWYAHYDVMPVDPVDCGTAAFRPKSKTAKYGHGADDKGRRLCMRKLSLWLKQSNCLQCEVYV